MSDRKVLKGFSGFWRETLPINLTLQLYRRGVREAVEVLPAFVAEGVFDTRPFWS